MVKGKKTSFDDAKKEFESYGYKVLIEESEYKGAANSVLCLCPKKLHNVNVTLSGVRNKRSKNGNGCKKCGDDSRKIPFNKVLDDLKVIGYKTNITEREYRGIKYPFPGQCVRDHDINILMTEIYKGSSCCKICGNIKKCETNMERRGVEYVSQDPLVKEKIMNTNIERRGVPYVSQDPIVKQKIINTNMEKRGVPHVLQDPIIKQQILDTNMERRGVPYPMQDPIVREKGVQTNMERRGVPYVTQDPIVKQKIIDTNMERRGVAYPSQDPNITIRCYKQKTYTYPSGNTTSYQGYEGF